MICAASEIGLAEYFPGEGEREILDLSFVDAKAVGCPLSAALGLDDVVFDIEVTTNRPDLMSVEELARAGVHYTRRELYERALRIGREHVGALVNTLAIAYAGASLPLLLLFFGSGDIDIGLTVNRELFATEIVRILVGSIGLVLAVPITTAVAVYILYGRTPASSGGHSHSV